MSILKTREINYNSEEDCKFIYEILNSNPENFRTDFKFEKPTYEDHKKNLKCNLSVLRIMEISNFPVGFGYVDNKNYVGFFYKFSSLKNILKKNNLNGVDVSKFFFTDVLSYAPKNKKLFACVNINNLIANKTASRLMNFESRFANYNLYFYIVP